MKRYIEKMSNKDLNSKYKLLKHNIENNRRVNKMSLRVKIADLNNKIEAHKNTIESIENEKKELEQEAWELEKELDAHYKDLYNAKQKAKKFFIPIGWIIAAVFTVFVCFNTFEWADNYREITNKDFNFISLLQNFEEVKSTVKGTEIQSGFETTEIWIWISSIMIVVALVMTICRIINIIKNKRLVSKLESKNIDAVERKKGQLHAKLSPYYERIETEKSAILSLTRYNGKEWDLNNIKNADISQLENDICDLFISIAYSPDYDNQHAAYYTWLFSPLRKAYEKCNETVKFISSKSSVPVSQKMQHLQECMEKNDKFMACLSNDMKYWNDIPDFNGNWYVAMARIIYMIVAQEMLYIPSERINKVFNLNVKFERDPVTFSEVSEAGGRSTTYDQDAFIDILKIALPKFAKLSTMQMHSLDQLKRC